MGKDCAKELMWYLRHNYLNGEGEYVYDLIGPFEDHSEAVWHRAKYGPPDGTIMAMPEAISPEEHAKRNRPKW